MSARLAGDARAAGVTRDELQRALVIAGMSIEISTAGGRLVIGPEGACPECPSPALVRCKAPSGPHMLRRFPDDAGQNTIPAGTDATRAPAASGARDTPTDGGA